MTKICDKSGIQGKLQLTTFKAGTEIVLRKTKWHKNLVVSNTNNGLNLVLQHLAGTTTYALEITSAKIGKDSTAATNNDTDLGNAIVSDIVVATVTETTTSQLTFEFFITDSELVEDTYHEFGLFSGNQIFSRSIISPGYAKSIGEDTKVEYVINLFNT